MKDLLENKSRLTDIYLHRHGVLPSTTKFKGINHTYRLQRGQRKTSLLVIRHSAKLNTGKIPTFLLLRVSKITLGNSELQFLFLNTNNGNSLH